MKQKVVIRVIVKRNGKVLLLRRVGGRPSIQRKYELPGGSLHEGEQPLDALKRSLQIHAGIEPETYRLLDVVAYQDPDFDERQYLFVVYEATLDRGAKVTTDDEYDRYRWWSLSDIQRDQLTSSTAILLNLDDDFNPDLTHDDGSLVAKMGAPAIKAAIIHSDGGSRGNPGPSASAYIIEDKKGTILAQGGKFLGFNDSGMAEYTAVELALMKAIELGVTDVDYYSDSLMVVNQMNGLIKVRNPEFVDIHDRIVKLLFNFRRIHFHHVHREFNRVADSLVNKIMDDNGA